jgi:hypothetical protein
VLYSIFALKQLLDGEASSPCNYFAARIFRKIRAERFNRFKVEPLYAAARASSVSRRTP